MPKLLACILLLVSAHFCTPKPDALVLIRGCPRPTMLLHSLSPLRSAAFALAAITVIALAKRLRVVSKTQPPASSVTGREGRASELVNQARAGCLEKVKRLLEAGADIDQRCPHNQSTALICAASRGSMDLVQYLLGRGANQHMTNDHNANAVRAALSFRHGRHLEVARCLMQHCLTSYHGPVVVIHTSGKVASTTLSKSLSISYPTLPVYDVHFLGQLPRMLKKHAEHGKRDQHLCVSSLLLELLDFDKHRVHVLSMVREPIGKALSNTFQSPDFIGVLDGEEISVDRIMEKLETLVTNHMGYVERWMAAEWAEFWGFAVFDAPFDRSRGCSEYTSPRGRMLVMHMAKLNQLGPEIEAFLGTVKGTLRIHDTNVAAAKPSAVKYALVRQRARFAPLFLRAVFSNDAVQHFFSAADIEACSMGYAREVDPAGVM